MSEKLRTEKARRIYERIERNRAELTESVCDLKNSVSSAKHSAAVVIEHPLSFITPKDFSMEDLTPKTFKNHPLATVAGGLIAGWGAGYLLRGNTSLLKNALIYPLAKIAKNSVNSKVMNKVGDELSGIAEKFIGDLLDKFKKNAEDFTNNLKEKSRAEDQRWEERPAELSNKYYHH